MIRSIPALGSREWAWMGAVVRYGLSGGVGLVVNVSLLVALVELAGVPTSVAPIASLAVALTVTLVFVDRWVFRQLDAGGTRTLAERGVAYYVVMVTGKLCNYGIYLALMAVGVPYPLAWVLGTGVVFLGTFLANRRVWRSTASSD